MSETECTTPAPEGATPEITKAEQLAWEAPALRPVTTRLGDREEWAHPCPPWCPGDGEEHDADEITWRTRRHVSPSLRVRTDGGFGYEDFEYAPESEQDMPVIVAAHLEVYLQAASRDLLPRIAIASNVGRGPGEFQGRRRTTRLVPLYPDEVRELIAVLQHLLKVGLEGQQ